MREAIRLRLAVAGDRDALVAMQEAAYEPNRAVIGGTPTPLTWDYDEVLARLEVWLAEDAAGLCGALILRPRDGDLYIESIAVAPRAKGGGIGNELLSHAEARAVASGYPLLRLTANARLTFNTGWYGRKGFDIEKVETIGERRLVHMVKAPAERAGAEATDTPGEGTLTDRLKGKRAFLTAAGAGIGRATAIAFAAEGAYVIATDLNPATLADLPALGIAETHALDVRSTEAVDALAAAAGAVDVLFNCAGFVHHGTALSTSDEDWDFSFDVNVKAMHRTIRAFLPGMLAMSKGSIINVSSGASSIRGIPNRYAYGASKAAVIGLTKAVAADHIRQGVRVNAIAPGTVQSPSLDGRIAEQAAKTGKSEAEIRQQFMDRQPMARLGLPEEIAGLAVFLASDESSYCTGQTYMADGGFAL